VECRSPSGYAEAFLCPKDGPERRTADYLPRRGPAGPRGRRMTPQKCLPRQ
jgi:hypothetical protein